MLGCSSAQAREVLGLAQLLRLVECSDGSAAQLLGFVECSGCSVAQARGVLGLLGCSIALAHEVLGFLSCSFAKARRSVGSPPGRSIFTHRGSSACSADQILIYLIHTL